MPSLNVKQEKNQSFAGYSLPPANSHEIDLFSLIEVLWQAKRRILATVFAFACVGLLLSFLLPQKMDQPGDCHTGGVGTVAGAGENVDRAARVGYGGKR
ncbi:LPS O-antigen length regulator [Salmonella enterica subsp. enterica serovar Agona str. 400095 11]|nr:LPS O-antigen length regulator [Salmonella enterica subsp. enterica serovar Agona str. 400095 11]